MRLVNFFGFFHWASKGNATRTLGKSTESLTYLTICRHSLRIGVVFYVRPWEKHCLLDGQCFYCFKPSESYLLKKMPDIFVKTGYGMTDMVIYCTELKFQHATNLDLNCLMFSIYNNTDTGKALLGISPHGTFIQ